MRGTKGKDLLPHEHNTHHIPHHPYHIPHHPYHIPHHPYHIPHHPYHIRSVPPPGGLNITLAPCGGRWNGGRCSEAFLHHLPKKGKVQL